MHPVGFIIRIYHDARSPERQKYKSYIQNHGKPKSVGAGTAQGGNEFMNTRFIFSIPWKDAEERVGGGD